jgi:hypothetical protein
MFRHGPSCLEGPVSRALAIGSPKPSPLGDAGDSGEPSSSSDPSRPVSTIRTELVERVRRAIAAGHYETAEKWQAALELLCRRLHDS